MLTEFFKKKLTRYFHMVDADKNGFVEQKDFEQIHQRFVALRGWRSGSPEYEDLYAKFMAVWNTYWVPCDENHDNQVSLDEFFKSFEKQCDEEVEPVWEPLVESTFDAIDLDGSGTIDLEEYKQYYRVFGLDENLAQEAFQHIDLNGDGSLSKEEFTQAFSDFFGDDPEAPGNWFLGSYG